MKQNLIMKKKKIDAYLVQETHLATDFEKTISLDYYLIHHGLPTQPRCGAKGGVTIILSPELATHWKSSKKQRKIIKGGTSIGETTRFLSISMSFDLPEGKNKQFRSQSLCLTMIYFPHSGYKENELEQINNDISSFYPHSYNKKYYKHYWS
jgi:hypothetical protein